jgi:hypothetical protein
MKTVLTLFAFFFAVIAEASNPDSVVRLAYKPEMGKYLAQVTELKEKIANATAPDAIRFYAKKIMQISDEMEAESNDFYQYRGSRTALVTFVNLNSKAATVTNALVLLNGDRQPLVTRRVNEIYDCATNIRFLWSKNPARIKKNLNRIDELTNALRS